jgi:hypothetical protein
LLLLPDWNDHLAYEEKEEKKEGERPWWRLRQSKSLPGPFVVIVPVQGGQKTNIVRNYLLWTFALGSGWVDEREMREKWFKKISRLTK